MKKIIKKLLIRILRPVVNMLIDEHHAHNNHLASNDERPIDALRNDEALRNIVRYGVQRPVDLTKIGQCYCYMFTSDKVLYEPLSAEFRHKSLRDVGPISDASCSIFPIPVLQSCFKHLWERGLEADFVDVGANVGSVSLHVAALMRIHKQAARVFAFECGLTAPLLQANIRVNGLEEYISAHCAAVCDMDSYVPMTTYCGYSEGARVHLDCSVPGPPYETLRGAYITNLVPSCRLDSFLADKARADNYWVIKIDTEGFDGDVIMGLSKLLPTGHVAIVCFEYSIIFMQMRNIDYLRPLTLLQQHNFLLFNLWDTTVGAAPQKKAVMERLRVDDEECMTRFFSQVSTNMLYGQTDLLAINAALPGVDDLIRTLREVAR